MIAASDPSSDTASADVAPPIATVDSIYLNAGFAPAGPLSFVTVVSLLLLL